MSYKDNYQIVENKFQEGTYAHCSEQKKKRALKNKINKKKKAWNGIWKTADNETMHYTDMTDTHLHNSILYLERALDEDSEDFICDDDDFKICTMMKLELLNEERLERGLPIPLVPYISLEYRRNNL